MDILFLLIPLSVILIFFVIYGLWWAVNSDQFDKLDKQGRTILDDEEHSDDKT